MAFSAFDGQIPCSAKGITDAIPFERPFYMASGPRHTESGARHRESTARAWHLLHASGHLNGFEENQTGSQGIRALRQGIQLRTVAVRAPDAELKNR